jgi:hypothetical protein
MKPEVIKAYGGMGVLLHLFLTSKLDGGECFTYGKVRRYQTQILINFCVVWVVTQPWEGMEPTFRCCVWGPVLNILTLQMEPIGSPETSVSIHITPLNVLEEGII